MAQTPTPTPRQPAGVDAALTTRHQIYNGFPRLDSQLVDGQTLQMSGSWQPFFRRIWQATQPNQVMVNQSSYTVADQKQGALSVSLFVNTSSGATAINLPDSPIAGSTVSVKDSTGNAATNNITVIATGGFQIDGTSNYVMNLNWEAKNFTFNGTSWSIV